MPHTASGLIQRDQITAARTAIAPYIRRTPTVEVQGSDLGLGNALTLKLELLQHTGSFKARGAFTNLLLRSVPPAGVVAAWAAHSGAMKVHAYDQEETLCGQGTVGAELQEQAPGLDTVLVPVGGGGLLGGLASWYEKSARLIGVEPEGSPTLTRALEAGRPVDAEARGLAADSLAPRRVGDLVFPIVQRFVDRVVLISDADIREAQAALWSLCRIVAEPGGAATFAAVLTGKYRPQPDERVGLVVSGGNTVAVDFTRQEKSREAK